MIENNVEALKNTFFIMHMRGSCRKTKQNICLSAFGSDSQMLVDTQMMVIPNKFASFGPFSSKACNEQEARCLF